MGLLDHHRIVINQKAKLIELVNEYKIRDETGADIGVIRDEFMTRRLAAYEAFGTKVLGLVRPRKIVKSSVKVYFGGGALAGTIHQEKVPDKIRFGLHDSWGAKVGEVRAENWRTWDFVIVDQTGAEVGRITKTWEGLANTPFTTADDYLLEVSPTLGEPLRLLAFASAVGVDLALGPAGGLH
jgi:hypothetical protein